MQATKFLKKWTGHTRTFPSERFQTEHPGKHPTLFHSFAGGYPAKVTSVSLTSRLSASKRRLGMTRAWRLVFLSDTLELRFKPLHGQVAEFVDRLSSCYLGQVLPLSHFQQQVLAIRQLQEDRGTLQM